MENLMRKITLILQKTFSTKNCIAELMKLGTNLRLHEKLTVLQIIKLIIFHVNSNARFSSSRLFSSLILIN
jgi:hypothetical protein